VVFSLVWTLRWTFSWTSTAHGVVMTITDNTVQSPSIHGVPAFPPEPAERLVLTVAEAGELLGISRAFAYELVARGELPVIRLGRRRLVPRRALLALIDAEPVPPFPASPTATPFDAAVR
jgi:excisionase family DNA binding protein